MEIPEPDYNLGINSLAHGAMTGRMIENIEKICLKENPDYVMVYGDTNSTLAGALAAAKLHINIAHIEAGLRSFNRKMPEEINRVLTDRISNLLFCPTSIAIKNLKLEGIEDKKSFLTGDVMLDAVLHYLPKAQKPSVSLPDEFMLATVHRSENTDDSRKLNSIFSAFEKLSQQLPIVLPLHPRTEKYINQVDFPHIFFIKPLGYFEMLYMLDKCSLVLTDSGGLQKEAYIMKKPCITLREQTEWVELIENKVNFLAGADQADIIRITLSALEHKMDFSINLYGDGNAGNKIINVLI
jgi:UDP-GlcNAc3NAcA epimerase